MEKKNDDKRWNRRNEAHPLSPRKMTLRSLLLVAETSIDTENGNVNHKESWKESKIWGDLLRKEGERKGVCGEERELKMVMSGKKFKKISGGCSWIFVVISFAFAFCVLLFFPFIWSVFVLIDKGNDMWGFAKPNLVGASGAFIYFIFILESYGLFLNTFKFMF